MKQANSNTTDLFTIFPLMEVRLISKAEPIVYIVTDRMLVPPADVIGDIRPVLRSLGTGHDIATVPTISFSFV